MGNSMRNIKNYIPYFLHDGASGLDVVFEGVILPSHIHHKSRNESATPNQIIDVVRKITSLEFFAAIRQFGFFFNNECLV